MDPGRLLVGDLLEIIGDNDASDRPFRLCDPDSSIYQLTNLRGDGCHMDVITRYILEKANQIDLLLEVPTHRHASLLTHDRDDALMIHLRIVEPIQQVDGTRAAGRKTYTDFAGELRVRTRHKRRHLFMPNLDVIDPIACAPDCANDSVDAITGKSEDPPDAPIVQSSD